DSRVESCTAPPSILRTATCRRARAKLSRSSRNSRSPRSRSNLSAVRGEMVPAKYPGYSNRKHTIPSAQSFRLSHCGNVASHQTDFCQLEFVKAALTQAGAHTAFLGRMRNAIEMALEVIHHGH